MKIWNKEDQRLLFTLLTKMVNENIRLLSENGFTLHLNCLIIKDVLDHSKEVTWHVSAP